MGAFNYRALDENGHELKGVLEGDSPRHIRQLLRERQLVPVEIKEVSRQKITAAFKLPFSLPFNQTHINYNDLVLVTQQIAILLTAGFPLEAALLTVSAQTEKISTKSIILEVRAKVLEGRSFASALSDFPQSFSELYQATVAAGEQAGRLDTVLLSMAEYLERQQFIRQKIQMSMVYPSLLTLVSLSIVTFLIVFVVPKVVGVFEHLNHDLPFLTQLLIKTSAWIKTYGIFFLMGISLLGWEWHRRLKNENIRRRYHSLLLTIPFIGYFTRTINTARFVRTFGILTNAGVPILEAMRVAAKLITNLPMRNAVIDSVLKVRQGGSVHAALEKTGYFPPITLHLIASGEASGNLAFMLERAASFQERAMTRLIDVGLTLFEPLMILFMGLSILFIVLAILLPIFDMNQLIS